MTSELLNDLVTAQAQARPEHPAVVLGREQLTYGQLDALSNQLARCLRQAGCGQRERVALLMAKSPMAIVALLAIYKANCVYVPLDPASPTLRLRQILESCEARWILGAGSAVALLEALSSDRDGCGPAVGWLDPAPAASLGHCPALRLRIAFTLADVAACSDVPLDCRASSADPAHILFTSGSTGTPKGVVITHANVMRFVEWGTKYFELQPSDRISGHPPLHFDLSFFDIFGAFAAGAQLHLVRPEITLMPSKAAELIRQAELTQWFSVPSVLNYMSRLDVVMPNDFPSLKRVLWCGEVLPTPALIYWMRRLPHVQFTNLYGPTETTIASSYYSIPEIPFDPQAPIPIGTACDGEELVVLDSSRSPAPQGEIGELYIGGAGLSPGYWRDPAKTEAVFVADPRDAGRRLYRTGDLAKVGQDGLLYFIGRTDSQIKSRGYRIELGEIEAALNAVGTLREGAVVAVPTEGFEGTAICCAYVPASGTDVTPAALRAELSKRLPSYMLPAKWLAFEQFPRNPNGKVDRPRLREVFETYAARAD